MRIDLVYGDDWSGLYVDDEIFAQDHSIRDDRWMDLVETAYRRGKRMSMVENEGLEFRWWEIDYGWLDSQRYLPSLFSEIPQGKLERTR